MTNLRKSRPFLVIVFCSLFFLPVFLWTMLGVGCGGGGGSSGAGGGGGESGPDVQQTHPIEKAVWQHMGGPPGGRGYDIRHKWDEPDTWFVTDTFSGVSISYDRGATWKTSNEGMHVPIRTGANDIYSLSVDPNNPQIIWAGTTEPGHFYKSTDAGLTWIRVDNSVKDFSGTDMTLGAGYGIRGFTIEPGNSDVVYAQGHVTDFRLKTDGDFLQYNLDKDAKGGRIFKTTDGGVTWHLIWEGRALARNLVIDPRDTRNLWATTGIQDIPALDIPDDPTEKSGLNCGGAGLLHSTDGGTNWEELGPHMGTSGINSTTMGTIDMSAIDPDTIMVGGGSDMCPAEPPAGQHGGVYLTHDGGATWNLVLKDDIISSVDFCDKDPERAYAVSMNAFYRSEDGGETWTQFTNPTFGGWGPDNIRTGFPIDTEADPDDCDRVLVNTYTGGVFLTTDGGQTFQISSEGYAGSFISGIWVDPLDREHVIVSSEMAPFERIGRGLSATWKGLLASPLIYGTSMLAASTAYPGQATDLLVANPGKISPAGELAIYRRTADNGWHECRPTLLTTQPRDMLKFTDIKYAPGDRLRVYAATAEIAEFSDIPSGDGVGLFYSTDGGSTWANSQDFQEKGFLRIAVHPQDALQAWAVGVNGVGVVKTADGGVRWEAMTDPGQQDLNAIAIPAEDTTQLWVGGSGGLMVWDGNTWVLKMTGLPELAHVSVILIDDAHEGVIYVGTFFYGVFYSTDGGDSFQRLDVNLPRLRGESLCVEHLALTPDGSTLYAGGHSGGLWRLDIPWD